MMIKHLFYGGIFIQNSIKAKGMQVYKYSIGLKSFIFNTC